MAINRSSMLRRGAAARRERPFFDARPLAGATVETSAFPGVAYRLSASASAFMRLASDNSNESLYSTRVLKLESVKDVAAMHPERARVTP